MNALEQGTGLRKAGKPVDIRVVIDGEDVIIRTRDDGRAFNLKRFADRIAEDDDPENGTGIRILAAAVKNVSYYRTYGMNTTIITI